jgi:hypothetical protein
MAVCPAGEDVIGPYLASKKDFADEVMRPLQAKREPVEFFQNPRIYNNHNPYLLIKTTKRYGMETDQRAL